MLDVTVAPTTNNLTTLTTAQRELQLGQADLVGMDELISAASEIVAQHCGRLNDDKQSEFGAQTVRQTERLVYRECIVLDRDLVPAITTIVEDGVTLTATDYELSGSRLFRLSDDTRIAWCAQKVVITYTTGWTLLGGMPHPIEQATLDVLRQLVARRGTASMVRSESVDGVIAVSYRDPKPEDRGLPDGVAQRLSPWVRIHL